MIAEAFSIETDAEDLARECSYRFLAAVVRGPFAPGWEEALDPINHALALDAIAVLGHDASDLADLIAALHAPPDDLRADDDRVFGLVVPKECPSFETEYEPTGEIFARSQQMADVAGFYRAFGIEPSRRSPERPDHLGLELEFLAFLLLRKRQARAALATDPEAASRVEVCERAFRDFVRDHLAWWVPAFASGLARKAGGRGFHAPLARLLACWVPAECRRLGIQAVLRPARPELIEPPEEQAGCGTCPLHP
jgi:TorA maturation chaperone TorD